MIIVFSNIEERDADFAIIRSFINNNEVRSLFFKRINDEGELVKVFHSKMQVESDGHEGESDIILICENKQEKFAIFIEDKIAADPQPSQRQRYEDRANLLKVEECYDKYYVVLCAPQAYLDTEKANGYDIKISHEEINDCLNVNDFEKCIFDFSTLEKKQGYAVIKNDAVTDFWGHLYDYIELNHPHLAKKKKITSARGGKAEWPTFDTGIKGLVIRWKTNVNYIDLEFSGMANHPDKISHLLAMIGCSNEDLFKTNKSLSMRRFVKADKAVDFHRSFADQIPQIEYAFSIINELYEIARKIKMHSFFSFPLNSDNA